MKKEKLSKDLIVIYISLIILIPIILFQTYVAFSFGSWENKKVLDKIKGFHKLIENNQSIPMEKFFAKESIDVLDKESFVNNTGFNPIINEFEKIVNLNKTINVTVDKEEDFLSFVIDFTDSNGQENTFVYYIVRKKDDFKFISIKSLGEEDKKSHEIKYHPRRFRI